MTEERKPAGVVPNIALSGRTREAIDLWKEAFGAVEVNAYAEGDGRIRHAEVEINGGYIFLTDFNMDQKTEFTPTPSISMHLTVTDGGHWMERAEAAGCRVLTPWQKMPFGGFGRLVDPLGVIWQVASPED